MQRLLLSFSLAALLLPTLSLALPAVASAQAGQENQPQPGAYCPHLTRDLKFRDRDAATGGQVTELQKFLADYYEDYPSWAITGNFRSTTLSFVQRFQREQNLPAFGYVGPLTRARIAQVCGGNTPSQNPIISLLFPTSGPIGTPVTITGSGFTNDNTVFFGNGVVPPDSSMFPARISSTNGGTKITITIPNELEPACRYSYPACGGVAPLPVTPGTYAVYVKNANGQSNSQIFTVASSQTTTSCTPEQPQTQTLSCLSGQTGAITQTRTSTCPGPVWGPWATTSNTCTTQQTQNASCTFNNQTIAHNASITAYQSSSVPNGQQCVSQTRTCSNGTLFGSYTNGTCTVQPPPVAIIPTCTYKGQSYVEGQTVTVPFYGSLQWVLTCDNAVWVLANGSPPTQRGSSYALGQNLCDVVGDYPPYYTRADFACPTFSKKAFLSVIPRHSKAALTVTAVSGPTDLGSSYTLSWGDGTIEYLPHEPYRSESNNPRDASTHTYSSSGSYTISYSIAGPVEFGSNSANIRVDP
ncbi:peptidoglycan-binding protein [Candidatus Kaiserbacteria bacterium]|nr:peptidoglycan-binding protein [Candidatus Kaiserbacteria bacterium]